MGLRAMGRGGGWECGKENAVDGSAPQRRQLHASICYGSWGSLERKRGLEVSNRMKRHVRACVASGGSLTLASAAVGHGKGVGVCDILQSLCSLHR